MRTQNETFGSTLLDILKTSTGIGAYVVSMTALTGIARNVDGIPFVAAIAIIFGLFLFGFMKVIGFLPGRKA